MPKEPLTPIEVAWLAGLLEGEGCFTTRGNKTTRWANGDPKLYPRIVVAMTDRDVVARAAELMGSYEPKIGRRKPPQQDMWWTELGKGAEVLDIMEQVLPLMGERRSKRIKELMEMMAYS